MPIETKRLKLPLPLGNESVSRVGINTIFEKIDEGVATREDVEELRQLVNEMDIPDASLTQKGKVQLSSKTDGMSESVAATEKAVKGAYDRGSAGITAAQVAHDIINNRDGFGITTRISVNNYAVTLTPAPTALVAGLRATIMINETNTSYVHLDVNGLGGRNILKTDGSLLKANALRANAVYSVVYNGANFILQGEGGEYGTAVAGDVRADKTIGTESGIVTGTMPAAYGKVQSEFLRTNGLPNGSSQVIPVPAGKIYVGVGSGQFANYGSFIRLMVNPGYVYRNDVAATIVSALSETSATISNTTGSYSSFELSLLTQSIV
ncbi:tail fiber protein [Paenibacillus sp. Z3-2]